MKIRNLKTKLNLKQKTITKGVGPPSKTDGRDGDFTVRWVKGKGLFLYCKWQQKWYAARFSLRRPREAEHKEPDVLPIGNKPSKRGHMSMDTSGKTHVSRGSASVKQIVGMDSANTLDIDTVKTSRANTASTSIGSNDDLALKNDGGDASLTLLSKFTSGGGAVRKDSYIN